MTSGRERARFARGFVLWPEAHDRKNKSRCFVEGGEVKMPGRRCRPTLVSKKTLFSFMVAENRWLPSSPNEARAVSSSLSLFLGFSRVLPRAPQGCETPPVPPGDQGLERDS